MKDVLIADQKENQESADVEAKKTQESSDDGAKKTTESSDDGAKKTQDPADGYKNHQWGDDEKWQSYLNNLYPIPE